MKTLPSELFDRRPHIMLLCMLLAMLPASIKLIYYPRNIGSDDAYIHLQVARNVISGHGWGLNGGAPVNLSSSPAFTLLLVAISKVTVHVILVTQILSYVASSLGLLLIFWTVRLETRSAHAALVAEGSAALSCDLWRWNGTVMEACIAFFVVALLLFLFRRRMLSVAQSLFCGMVAGVAILLRPELLLAAVLCACAAAMTYGPQRRMRGIVAALAVLGGASLCLAPWLSFARLTFGTYLPTTFHAKSIPGLLLWNPTIVKQMLELTGESYLWPAILFLLLAAQFAFRRVEVDWQNKLLPAGILLGVVGFYYLKTPGLESAGRYMLPFLPCAAVLLGDVCSEIMSGLDAKRMLALSVATLVLQAMTSLVINQVYLASPLARFESEYGATMRAAAEFIASRVRSPNESVLAEVDVGVLAYAANGRFHIYDGGGLSSPELARLSPEEQVQLVQPDYVIESQGSEAAEWEGKGGGRMRTLWFRRYRQHSISQSAPYLFANIYDAWFLASER